MVWQGLASSDHTTLLLNCYTKLKDVEKLDEFLRGSGAAEDEPSLRFDVETAIKVTTLACSDATECTVLVNLLMPLTQIQ